MALPLVILATAWVLERPLNPEIGKGVYDVVVAVPLGAVIGAVAGRSAWWAEDHREIGGAGRPFFWVL